VVFETDPILWIEDLGWLVAIAGPASWASS